MFVEVDLKRFSASLIKRLCWWSNAFKSSEQINLIMCFSFRLNPPQAYKAVKNVLGKLLLCHLHLLLPRGAAVAEQSWSCLAVTKKRCTSNELKRFNRMQVNNLWCFNVSGKMEKYWIWTDSVWSSSIAIKAMSERRPWIKPRQTRQMSLQRKETALVHLMWFQLLHFSPQKNHSWDQLCLYGKLQQFLSHLEAAGPPSSSAAKAQEHCVKAVLCLRNAFCARVSIHFTL